MNRYSRITGTGSYLPPRRLTNADLAAELAARGVETSDEWIVERTGIRARHFAAPDVTASDLGAEAARRATGPRRRNRHRYNLPIQHGQSLVQRHPTFFVRSGNLILNLILNLSLGPAASKKAYDGSQPHGVPNHMGTDGM